VSSHWLPLVFGSVSLMFSFNERRPHYRNPSLAVASFFAGWLRAELALQLLLLEGLLLAWFARSGMLRSWPGGIGAAFLGASIISLLLSLRLSFASGAVVDESLVDFVRQDAARQRLRWRRLLLPVPLRPRSVECLRNRVYHAEAGLRLRLDVYRQRQGKTARPGLIYVHGGGWIVGSKWQQGRPLVHHLAERGWVCCSIEYRLSPGATFPDHLIDVKRAIAWVRAHADELGIDPTFLVVAGNSAGGHLAALAALTAGDRALQPGFADADTSVAACISLYGIYDLGNRHGHWPHRGMQDLVEHYVLKARLAEEPARFEAASPIAHVGPHAPPFLVVHGSRDSIVPVAEARSFVAALRRVSACAYIEVPGAQHAFDVFPSVRAEHLLRGLDAFGARCYERHRARDRQPGAAPRL
jgi:acetyl esterase/lipase